MGSTGYMLCFKFYQPVAITSAFLMEPIVAQALGVYLGIDNLPGVLTYLGVILVIIGIYRIQKFARESKKNFSPEEEQTALDLGRLKIEEII